MHFRINEPSVVHEIFEDEVVIIHLNTGSYFSLNEVGADVWLCLEREMDNLAIIEALAERYGKETADISLQLTTFLDKLASHNLVIPVETGEATPPDFPPLVSGQSYQAPTLTIFNDMQDLLLIDPIHEVDETGWPNRKPEANS